MKFNEVEKSLKEGKKIKLASWKNAYWHYDKDMVEQCQNLVVWKGRSRSAVYHFR